MSLGKSLIIVRGWSILLGCRCVHIRTRSHIELKASRDDTARSIYSSLNFFFKKHRTETVASIARSRRSDEPLTKGTA